MKTVFLAQRVIKVKGVAVASFPLGVFTDKEDAEGAASEVPRLVDPADQAKAVLSFVGITEVGGAVTELPFVAGAGLVMPSSKIIAP